MVMKENKTNIAVSKKLWGYVNTQRICGESMEQTLLRLLNLDINTVNPIKPPVAKISPVPEQPVNKI